MPDKLKRWQPQRPKRRATKETAHYRTAAWHAKRLRVLVRDAFTCQEPVCGRVVSDREAHVDHVIPLEDGGSDDEGNLLCRCSSCHGRKTAAEQRRKGFL
jgi:5-methylcytosine-specific restriction protein A